MRIFYTFPAHAHDGMPDSLIWDFNFYHPLRALGHEVVRGEYNFLAYNKRTLMSDGTVNADAVTRERPLISERLLAQVKAAHAEKPIDLFLSYFYSAQIDPAVITAIRALGIMTINWYCNGSYQMDLVAEIAPHFDYCLVPEKFRLKDYQLLGANPIYCQEAANPSIYKPHDVPRTYDISFVGQCYGNRPHYLGYLNHHGLSAYAFGPKWHQPASWKRRLYNPVGRALGLPKTTYSDLMPRDKCGLPLSDEELIKMYSRSHISLGFTTLAQKPSDDAPDKQVRLRDFEAPMSGAFYMVEAFEELADFFEPDKEIVFFSSEAELVDKCRFYLKNPAAREAIRAAGLARAQNEHTWQQRLAMVFRTVGLPERGSA